MHKIKICSSSSIIESNTIWKSLKSKYEIKFTNYGDVISPFLNNKIDHTIVMVLMFEDLIREEKENIFKRKSSDIFNAIKKKSKASSKPIIVLVSKGFGPNILRSAKKNQNDDVKYKFLINNFDNLKRKIKNFYFIELDNVFSLEGYNNIYSNRNWYYARCRLSIQGLQILVNQIAKILNRCFNAPCKVLALDCDNTIWGGVVGEDGLKNLILGQDGLGTAYVDFQREIKKLVKEGVILVICSKNNENDVWKVFNEHDSMVLTKDEIVSYKINWDEKTKNLIQISEELNLNLDSFVFWDDNPVEQNKVKKLLPQVKTIETPKDVCEWPNLIKNLDYFAKFKVTKDDNKKVEQYKSRANFVKNVNINSNVNDFLKSINLKPEILSLSEKTISRAEQLCKKTNQFNLRTIRHSETDLNKIKKKNNDFVFLVKLVDDYGDHGIVSLICLEKIDKDLLFLNTFLMSCRVIGRHLESWILSKIFNIAKKYKFNFLIAEFKNSGKNNIAEKFLKEHKFISISKNVKLKKIIEKSSLDINSSIFYLDVKKTKIQNLDIYEKK